MFLVKIFLTVCAVVVLIHYATSNCDEFDVLEVGVSERNAALIVERHNKYRQDIMDGNVPGQPRGMHLKYLKWDKELARSAQGVAETCEFKHVTVKDDRWRYRVGQSLYRAKNGNWSRAVEYWFLEHEDYKFGRINMNYVDTGHYTQLIWDNTELIGCGFVSYEKEIDSSSEEWKTESRELYVCHYGPPGNIYGKYPYKVARDIDER